MIQAVHTQAALLRVPFDGATFEDAVELPVVANGTKKDAFSGKITQFVLRSGYVRRIYC